MIRDLLFDVNPYKGFRPKAELLEGWGSNDPNFARMIYEVQPKLIIEVGSWLGASAIHMATCMSIFSWPKEIICVDTWLGSREMWTDMRDETRMGRLALKNGYPSIYYQFLSNVVKRGFEHMITPLPATSLQAARILEYFAVKADLVFIDASHDYDDVLADIQAYWPLLTDNGAMIGDDWETFRDVYRAVEHFAETNKLKVEYTDRQWVLRK